MLEYAAAGGAALTVTAAVCAGWAYARHADGHGSTATAAGPCQTQGALIGPAPPATVTALPAGDETVAEDNAPRLPPLPMRAVDDAAERFMAWIDRAHWPFATADEAWMLYGEHCLDEGCQMLPQRLVMAEVAKRCWRGQKRMGSERPTVYVFDLDPKKTPRESVFAERRRSVLDNADDLPLAA